MNLPFEIYHLKFYVSCILIAILSLKKAPAFSGALYLLIFTILNPILPIEL
jgi:hypothetical protein